MTGSQITRYFSVKSVQENINIPYSSQPFKDNKDSLITKRAAFYQNLICFPSKLQYKIILEVCERFNKDDFDKLRNLTVERYGELNSKKVVENKTEKIVPTKLDFPDYEKIITAEIQNSKLISEKINVMQSSNRQVPTWYKQPKYFIPIFVAIISGLFLVWQANIQKEKPLKSEQSSVVRETYELILIDHVTFKTPIFKIPNAKLKIYNSTPPTVIQIVDGTAKFESEPKLLEKPVLIEFENISTYSIVDRGHTLKIGKNEILVKKK